jgi:hypothetical protein
MRGQLRCLPSPAENKTTNLRAPVAERPIALPPLLQQRENIMTPAEIKGRRVLALRLFYALCAHYPDKHIALSIQPRDVADDEPDDLTLPKTAG